MSAGEVETIQILWVAFVLSVVAVVFDVRSRQIPDSLSVCLLGLALVATGFHLHSVNWLSLVLGMVLGFGSGLILFRMGGFGGGDVKLLASLGAVLGFRDELIVMLYVALVGGLLALVALLRGQREYAYAPAIALGLLSFILKGYWR